MQLYCRQDGTGGHIISLMSSQLVLVFFSRVSPSVEQVREHLFTIHFTNDPLRQAWMRTPWLVSITTPHKYTGANDCIASVPFTFRVGTPTDESFESFLSVAARRSQLAARDDSSPGFTGNHKLVIVLVILALLTAVLLVVFSMRQAKRQEKEAKERGAFVRGLQLGDVGFMKIQELDTRK
jgi:hypothetical protein